MISESTAKVGGGNSMSVGFLEMIEKMKKPIEKRTPEQIVTDVIKGAGIEVIP